MIHYFLRRIFQLCLSLFIVVTCTFFLMHSIPGDPFTQDQMIPEEILHSMKEHYGLNKPLIYQYGSYMIKLLSGNLGPSIKYEGISVEYIIRSFFPVSLIIGSCSLVIALIFGLILGTISAFYRNTWQGTAFMVLSSLTISIPSFLVATLLQYIFAVRLGILPIARYGSFEHLILPALSLSITPMLYIAKLTRSTVVEMIDSEYVLVARAKGLTSYQVFFRHMMKNALLPCFAYIGNMAASILVGSFVIEKIFGIPGLGSWYVNSIANRDYTVIMGLTIFYSFILMTLVALSDILSGVLDPRVKRFITNSKSV